MQRQQHEIQFSPLPEDLESPAAKLVYFYLQSVNGATVDAMKASLCMRQLTILGVLDALTTKGVVERRGDEYVIAR